MESIVLSVIRYELSALIAFRARYRVRATRQSHPGKRR